MAKFWDSSSGLGDAKWLRDIWGDLLGGSDHSSGIPKLGKNLALTADSLLGPEGFLAYPKRTWDHWADQLTGGGDDDGNSRSSASTMLTTPTDDEPPPGPVDPGLSDPTPLAGDVQMSTYLAQKRRKIGNKKGRVDTMLTRGQDIADVENRMMLS